MFKHSDTFWKYQNMHETLRGLMITEFVKEFVDHLHSFGPFHETVQSKAVLIWIGERGTYSGVVAGADAQQELYGILRLFSHIDADPQKLASLVEELLNERYGGEDAGWLHVYLKEYDNDTDGYQELMTFKYGVR